MIDGCQPGSPRSSRGSEPDPVPLHGGRRQAHQANGADQASVDRLPPPAFCGLEREHEHVFLDHLGMTALGPHYGKCGC